MQLSYFDACLCGDFTSVCIICGCTDCNCDQRGTVPNTHCDPVSHSCQCKVRELDYALHKYFKMI